MTGRSFLVALVVLVVAALIGAYAPWEREPDAHPLVETVELAESDGEDLDAELGGVGQTSVLIPASVGSPEPGGSRVDVPGERWTLHFDLETAYAAEDAPAVEPPVYLLIRGASEVLERTLAQRDEAGRFQLELPLSGASLRSSTVYFALDPAALGARGGTALRLDGLSDRVRLGKYLPGAGVWDSEERTVDCGSVALYGPLVTSVLSLGGARFADLDVVIMFYGVVVEPSELDLAIGDPFTGESVIKPVQGSEFGRARFSLDGDEERVLFGTFGEPRAWRVTATSPDLRSTGLHRSQESTRPDWSQNGHVGQEIRLPFAGWLDLDVSIDLQRMPDAGLTLFRAYAEPTVFELSAAELEHRSQNVAVATAAVTPKAAARPTLIPLGKVQLNASERHSVEVWSRPDGTGKVRLLHTQEIATGRGHRRLAIQ